MSDKLLFGVDASFDQLSLDEAKRLKAVGVSVFQQCLWTATMQPPDRIINLRNAINGGLIPMGYISINESWGGHWHVDKGRGGIPDDIWDALALVPVDVELKGITEANIRRAVERTVSLGKRRSIYTSYNAWVNLVVPSNPQSFTDCLLQNAFWDEHPDFDFPSWPYGGWTIDQVVGEQWSGGSYVEDVFVDRDTFVRDLLVPPDPCIMLRLQNAWLLEAHAAVPKGVAAVRDCVEDWEKL